MSLSELLNENEEISYLTAKEKELLECYRMMPDDQCDALLAFIKTLN